VKVLIYPISAGRVRNICCRLHDDLEEFWPELAGDKDVAGFRVIGDAVQDSLGVGPFSGRQKVAEVQVSKYPSGPRGDPDDAICMPDVRVDFAANVL
jgi:hypothetical protein